MTDLAQLHFGGLGDLPLTGWHLCCSKITEAEAAVSVNEKKWLVMHVHVQLRLDELWGPPNLWFTELAVWTVLPANATSSTLCALSLS